jgi:predicted SprT family Zn-dependent metalloprotease
MAGDGVLDMEVRRMTADMKAERLVCPNCHESVQHAGIVKVETGLTQFQSFYYHPHAQQFMFDDWTEQDHGAATRWLCRACRRELPGEITEYIDQHTAW